MIALTVLGQAGMAMPAMAEETKQTQDVSQRDSSVIDTSKKGKLTINKEVKNSGADKTATGVVEGAQFTVLKVADLITRTDAGEGKNALGIGYRLNSSGEKLGFGKSGDVLSPKQVQDLADAVAGTDSEITMTDQVGGMVLDEDKMKAKEKVQLRTNDKGKAVFDGLGLGLYIVAETNIDSAKVYGSKGDLMSYTALDQPAAPFLVSLPNTADDGASWQYDITATPKDSSVSIHKKIISDRKKEDQLVDTNDYQIGQTIPQVIYSDVPVNLLGAKNKSYVISDTMSEGLTFDHVTKVAVGDRVSDPQEKSAFDDFTVLTEGTDYTVTSTSDHTFKVELSDDELAELDKRTSEGQVVVFFDSVLNKKAFVGTDKTSDGHGNENTPRLDFSHTGSGDRQVEGNTPEVYTYELDITKKGPQDPSGVTFDVKQGSNPVQFIGDENGVYHVYNAKNDQADAVTTSISPDANGKLRIYGLDSKTYTFTEQSTVKGYSLLKSSFKVDFQAKDPTDQTAPEAGKLDGKLESALLQSTGAKDVQLEGKDDGKVKLSIQNHKAITLHTGGEGDITIYLFAAGAAAAAAAAGTAAVRAKRRG